jgi:hypothetical protein
MSLGGKTTEKQQIDPALRDAALAQLDMARAVGQLGFVPYKGDTVAGFQPNQIAAIQNNNAGMDAFGFSTAAAPTGGNLSPYAIYQEQLAQMDPGQREFIDSLFINPITGAAPTRTFGPQNYYNAPQTNNQRSGGGGRDRDGGGGGSASTSGSRSGGYNSFRDMFDGGGPGRSGSTFSGGGRISDAANRSGINPADGRGRNAGGPGRTSTYGK